MENDFVNSYLITGSVPDHTHGSTDMDMAAHTDTNTCNRQTYTHARAHTHWYLAGWAWLLEATAAVVTLQL